MFDIYQTDFVIHSKLRIFPLFGSHTWKYNIQVNERLTKMKEKCSTIQFDIYDLSFSSFQCPRKQVINRSDTCYFLHASN